MRSAADSFADATGGTASSAVRSYKNARSDQLSVCAGINDGNRECGTTKHANDRGATGQRTSDHRQDGWEAALRLHAAFQSRSNDLKQSWRAAKGRDCGSGRSGSGATPLRGASGTVGTEARVDEGADGGACRRIGTEAAG